MADRRRPARGRRAERPDHGLGWTGTEFEVTVGAVAHGGHCVARHEGRVVFVRHSLPGERVVVRVTEDRHAGFCRADAIEVLSPAPGRVERPCPYSGPGKCGGCDWQHVAPEEQHRLKAAAVGEQLARLAGLADVDVSVDAHGVVTTTRMDRRGRPQGSQVLRPGSDVPEEPAGRAERRAGGRDWEVEGTGFWQVHPAAADALVAAVTDFARVRPGETVLDLYAGAGLFGGALAPAVRAGGRVVWGEADEAAFAATGARAVVYVACDPAALARDVATFGRAGYRLAAVRAFDAFPMTAHVECVALLVPAG